MDDSYSIKEFLAHNLADMKDTVKEIHADILEIKADGKETKGKIEFQNGRVRKLEDWAIDSAKIIEYHTTSLDKLKLDYSSDKARLWGAIAVVTLLGGAIVTLSIMAIDNKIYKGIANALSEHIQETVYAE